jgi:2-amino-4-hydroxy-6-hydroxymethyldihydropteridine diphosphokinase
VTERAFLSLGSNIEPERSLPRAVRGLRSLGRIVACSNVYQNPAIGPAHQPDFLNSAVLLETAHTPRALRAELRRLEERLGRRRTLDKYAPRTIDIDIVLFGSRVLYGPETTAPDPGLLIHAHIAIPAAELDPDYRHPVTGETLGSIADRLRLLAALTPRPDVTFEMWTAAGLAPGGSQE